MSHIAEQFNGIIQFLKSSGPLTVDLIVLFVMFVFFFVFTSYFGRQIITAFIIAFYPANLLYKSFPLIDRLIILHGDTLITVNQIIIFLIFLVPLIIIITRYISESNYTGTSHALRTAGLSIGGVIIILLFSYGIISLDKFHHFSPIIDAVFAGHDRIFWWNLAPLALLAIL